MKSELIVDVQAADVSIALLEDGRLVSLQKEARNIAYAVGDIYLAKVKKLMPGLNAAFVNVGYEKDAFLHYLDLGSHFSSYEKFVAQLLADRKHQPRLSQMKLLPEIDKHGSVTDLLAPGKELLVQIVKEPISSKGPASPPTSPSQDATSSSHPSATKYRYRRKSNRRRKKRASTNLWKASSRATTA